MDTPRLRILERLLDIGGAPEHWSRLTALLDRCHGQELTTALRLVDESTTFESQVRFARYPWVGALFDGVAEPRLEAARALRMLAVERTDDELARLRAHCERLPPAALSVTTMMGVDHVRPLLDAVASSARMSLQLPPSSDPESVLGLAGAAIWEHVRSLKLISDPTFDLLASEQLGDLEELELFGEEHEPDGYLLGRLAELPIGRRLRSLRTCGFSMEPSSVTSFLGQGRPAQLESLYVELAPGWPASGADVPRAEGFVPRGLGFRGALGDALLNHVPGEWIGSRLETLELAECGIGPTGFERLSALELTPTRLVLDGSRLRASDIEALVDAGVFAHVRELSLCHCALDDAALVALTRAGGVDLERLWLVDNAIGARGAARLAEWERARGLVQLDLSGNPIGDAGATSLAEAPFERLASLTLRACEIGDVGAEALARTSTLAWLQELHLRANVIRARGAAAFGVRATGIGHLELAENPIDEWALRSVLLSPRRSERDRGRMMFHAGPAELHSIAAELGVDPDGESLKRDVETHLRLARERALDEHEEDWFASDEDEP